MTSFQLLKTLLNEASTPGLCFVNIPIVGDIYTYDFNEDEDGPYDADITLSIKFGDAKNANIFAKNINENHQFKRWLEELATMGCDNDQNHIKLWIHSYTLVAAEPWPEIDVNSIKAKVETIPPKELKSKRKIKYTIPFDSVESFVKLMSKSSEANAVTKNLFKSEKEFVKTLMSEE